MIFKASENEGSTATSFRLQWLKAQGRVPFLGMGRDGMVTTYYSRLLKAFGMFTLGTVGVLTHDQVTNCCAFWWPVFGFPKHRSMLAETLGIFPVLSCSGFNHPSGLNGTALKKPKGARPKQGLSRFHQADLSQTSHTLRLGDQFY